MADEGRLQRFIRLVLDRASANKLKAEAQEALDEGTDPRKATRNLGQVGGAMEGLRKFARKVRLDLIALIGGVTGLFVAVGQGIREVQDAYATVRRSTGDTGATFRTLRRDLFEAFATGPEKIGEVAVALGSLRTSLGLLGTDLQNVTRLVLDFARVNGQEVGAAADMVGTLVIRMGLNASDVEGLLDRITLASQASGASVAEVGQTLLSAGPQLAQLGYSIDQQIALIAQLRRIGADVPGTIMGMQQAMTRLAQGGATDLREAFSSLLSEIQDAPSDTDALRIASEAFGSRVAARMVPDIRAGRFEVEEFTAVIAGAAGTLRDTAAESETMGEQLRADVNAIKATFLPAISAMGVAAQWLASIFTGVLLGAIRTVELAVDEAYFGWLRLREGFLAMQVSAGEFFGRDMSRARADLDAVRQAQWDLSRQIEMTRKGQEKQTVEADATAEAFARVTEATVGLAVATEAGAEVARKSADERIKHLVEARKLGIATREETLELVRAYFAMSKAIEDVNLATEERIRLRHQLTAIEAVTPVVPNAPQLAIPDRSIQLMPMTGVHDLQRTFTVATEIYRARMLEWEGVSQTAASNFVGAWEDAFTLLLADFSSVAEAGESLARGLAAGFLGALAQYAQGKVAENIALAAENVAKGLAASVTPGLQGTAAGFFAAAKGNVGAAALWGVLAGASGGASNAVGGSGAAPAGGTVAASRVNPNAQGGGEVHVYIDAFDPANPVHYQAVGQAIRNVAQTSGRDVIVHRGRGPR